MDETHLYITFNLQVNNFSEIKTHLSSILKRHKRRVSIGM